MAKSAKSLHVSVITSKVGRAFICRHHYSGKVVPNSQLYLAASLDKRIVGVLAFGPPMVRRKVLPLVRGTAWNGMLELNRMAFVDATPRNSESRCLAVAFRLIRKHLPEVEWVLSYADATQCGDGTVYRAAGGVLTGIHKNRSIWETPPDQYGRRQRFPQPKFTKSKYAAQQGGVASMQPYREAGWRLLKGFQIRYIFFLNPNARSRLVVPELPFSAIYEAGAGMYKGERKEAANRPKPPENEQESNGVIENRTQQDATLSNG